MSREALTGHKDKSSILVWVIVLMFLLVLTPARAAHFVCGKVNDCYDGTSASWHNVTLHYPNDLSKNSSCMVNPETSIFCCDIESFDASWKIGDTVSAFMPNSGDGYWTAEVSTTLTGDGYDVMPESNLNVTVVCNDSICHPTENCLTCESDCGICPQCGDDVCHLGEDCTSCPADCGECAVPVSPTGTAPGGNSASGSRLSAGVPIRNSRFTELSPDKPIVIKLDSSSAINDIIIVTKKTLSNVKFEIYDLTGEISSVSNNSRIYSYVQINKFNIKNDDLSSVILRFNVDKNWLGLNQLSKEDIIIERISDEFDIKEKLNITKISDKDSYYQYETQTSGFSFFLVYGKSIMEYNLSFDRNNSDAYSAQSKSKENKTSKSSKIRSMILAAIIFSLLMLEMYRLIRISKKN